MSQGREEQPTTPAPADGRAERWRELRLSLGLSQRAVRRARLQALVFGPMFAGVILVWEYRHDLFALKASCSSSGHAQVCTDPGTTALQIVVVIALVILGWAFARDVGRAAAPVLSRRVDASTAGSAGFVIRLLALVAALVLALRIAEVSFAAIAIGASFSAVVFGLAAQQTLGNLIAGIVLLSARPFRVGDTVRLQGGQLAGQIEGVVSALGLLYTTFDAGGDPVLVPNSVVLSVSVRPLREPAAVTLRARLPAGSTPLDLQQALEEQLTVPIRRHTRVMLEEIDAGGEVLVTITASPRNAGDGGRLATELLDAIARETGAEAAGGQDRET